MAVEKTLRIVVIGMMLFLWTGYATDRLWGQGSTSPAAPGSAAPARYEVPYYGAPGKMDLCGEPVPLHLPDVRERFDREFTMVVYSHAQVYLWLKRMERFFPLIEKELAQKGLPDDLKWVAVAESDLIASAVSSAGAAGPWQFIPGTGSRYGLCQTGVVDERYDFEQATESAFRYLRDLQKMFDNWALALAAYNCGEGRVRDEMAKQGVRNYYQLKLPLETERYVMRILAIKEVLSKPERYGFHLPRGAGYPVIAVDRVNLRLASPMSLVRIAEAAGTTYRDIKNLNPCLVAQVLPAGSITLKVPAGKGADLERKLETVRAEPAPEPVRDSGSKSKQETGRNKVVYHKVARGETLSGIASRYDVTMDEVCKWNGIKGRKVQTGQKLKIVR